MKKSNVLIIDESELRQTIKQYYSDILKDTASEIIEKGLNLVPAIIMNRGVDNLDYENLVAASHAWAEMQMDNNPDCDGIIMVTVSGNYLLTSDTQIEVIPKLK